MYVRVYEYVCMYVCMYVCICTHSLTHAHTSTHTHTHTLHVTVVRDGGHSIWMQKTFSLQNIRYGTYIIY
jgi:hypothetical protein